MAWWGLKNGCNGNFHLIKSFLLAVVCFCCSCCFLWFFRFCFFCLFFDDLFFFCVCFHRFAFFLGGLRILTASNLLPFLCVHLLSWALVFSLCWPSSLPCSFSCSLFLVIFFLLPITRIRRGECVLSTYIGHSPSCSYPKRNLKYVADGAGGEERGKGGGVGVCAALLMLWKKHTRTHTRTLGNIWHRQGSRSLVLIYFFLSLSPSVALPFLLTISLFMSLSPFCFVSAKFRNKEKFAVAIFCILKCGLYSSYMSVYTGYLHANLKCSVDLLPLLLPPSFLPHLSPPPPLLTFPLQPFFFLLPSLAHCSAKASPKGSPKSF